MLEVLEESEVSVDLVQDPVLDQVPVSAVKLHDPSIVEDWSSLKDDNGEYPGERVAMAYAEKHGILEGANRPDDITVGEVALILYNAEKAFEE